MNIAMERSDPAFPAALRATPDAPERLWIRSADGTLPARRPAIAIVGARAASGHGLARARELALELAGRGALVVSGGAIGIDAAAHAGALEAGAPTVVVLATPLDAPYPGRNRGLYDEVVRRGGALVSSFAPGAEVQRWHFPKRNRVIAGLCDATVVVEASPGSGSLYTAAAAAQYGRVLAVCPGTPGTEALLAQGAALVERAEDVLGALDGAPRTMAVAAPAAGSEAARALAALDAELARDPETVAEISGLPVAAAARALLGLELGGLALVVPGGRYVRSALSQQLMATLTH